MANIATFRINYKSDFVLTLNSDAGWMTPFCIKFWTGAPSQAYFVGFDGTTYTHCAPVEGEPTKLVVQFDDHHLPIGDLKFQIGYHFTVDDFPTTVEDEVINQASVIIEVDDAPAQVMLDLNGETAPEIEFSLPAYANEAQRIANEQQRIAAETQRIANEETRIANEQTRINQEQTRQQNEAQRIQQEQARVNEYAELKADAVAATSAANDAAALANAKAQLAADKAALADAAATLANQKAALAASAAQLANDKAALAQQKAEYAQTQGGYAKDQGDYAKDKGEICAADHLIAVEDHGIAAADHTQAGNDHTRAESDHGIAVDDHTQAGNDHTRAESDHGIAVDDHTQAGNDHTRAESDHVIAADDHTQAGNDHTRAESDHTRAESDHAAVAVYVDSLGAFDISAYHATGGVLATYADLSAALGSNGANIPELIRKGGMSVRFVQSYDNTYRQCRLKTTYFSTNADDWECGIDTEIEKNTGRKALDFNIRNGSQGNSGNAWVITICGSNTPAIPVTPGRKYMLRINKPAEAGFDYYWRVMTYTTDSPTSLTSNIKRNEINDWNSYHENRDIYLIDAGEAGLTIQLTELTAPGAGQDAEHCIPLRNNSFTDGEIMLHDVTDSIDAVVDEIKNDIEDDRVTLCASNDNDTPVVMYENTYKGTGAYIKFGYLSAYYNNTSRTYTMQLIATQVSRELVTSPKGITNCIFLGNGESLCFNSKAASFVIRSREKMQYNDHLLFAIRGGRVSSVGDCITGIVQENNTRFAEALYTALNAIDGGYGKIVYFRNGSAGNPNNANLIVSHFIPSLGKKHIRVLTNRPNTQGFKYVYGFIYTNDYRNTGNSTFGSNAIGTYGFIVDINETTFNNYCNIPDTAANIAVIIGESNGASLSPIRVVDFDRYDINIELYDDEPVVKRNQDRYPMLINSCRYHKQSLSSKDFQVLLCTDSHDAQLANGNAVKATNGINVIDAYVHCGDIVGVNYATELAAITAFQEQISSLTKPGYIVVGNHDVGNCNYVGYAASHQQAYDAYIKPMVDKGWLVNGEYEAGNPYWFHDIAAYKIRLIGLYEYDDNLDFDETYWKAVEYDSEAPQIAFNTAYTIGSKVNAYNYTGHSFECVQAVTTPANYYTTPQHLPSYKVTRGMRVIRQTQAQWFLDKLASTPSDYGVIILTHNPFSDTAVSMDKKFSWPSGIQGSSWTQTCMATNFIKNAIVAFKTGSDYSEKVVMSGSASYLNTLNDGSINYAYEVSKDFSVKNTGAYLLGLLGGHCHRDIIWKDGDIYQIAANCAKVDAANDRNSDIRRTATDGLSADSLTVVSIASGRFGLVKLGVNVTENGTFRDYEVIDTNV